MAKSNVRRGDRGAGADLINNQRAVDDAINQRIKEDNQNADLDPAWLENKNRVRHRTDVSEKKTGHTKH